MSKDPIDFEPINQRSPGSRIALTIYPPGASFGRPGFRVFVGGCGRGAKRTLTSAKAYLLELAVAECDERIARAKAEAEHYERERQKLIDGGLRPEKRSRR